MQTNISRRTALVSGATGVIAAAVPRAAAASTPANDAELFAAVREFRRAYATINDAWEGGARGMRR